MEGRGRARSNSMHEEIDEDMSHEIETLNAKLEGREPPPPPPKKAAAGKTGQLSKKTITMLTDLEAATATPPELGGSSGNTLSEEELAERELEELEKKKRAGIADASAGGGGAKAVTVVKPAAAAKKAGKDDAPAGGAGKEYDIAIKLLLLGDSGVGKTSLMMRYAEDKFSSGLLATAGVDYQTQYLDIEGKRVKCQIWDTAGQQRFHVITQAYYKGAHGIVLVYDAADQSETTFNNVRYWMENIKKHANSMVQKILIGNKIDMKGKKIETARGKGVADEFSMRFVETSAKDGTGVKEAFNSLARDIVLKMIAAGITGTEPANAAAAKAGAAAAAAGKDGKKDKDCSIM